MATTQTRQLEMDPKLLLDVIGRQAGSLDKAVLEGGMNGIEAINALEQNGGECKDRAIYITYVKEENGRAILGISDSGKGITTKEEVKKFFETFGTPHDENEHKIYAQFRMGRGQMFNFGRNVWRTGPFKFVVDIMKNGLSWELEEDLPFVEGCHITIELYDKYINSWPARTVDCLKEAVKKQMDFVDMPVFFNKEQINTPPQDLKWDMEDEFAYYAFNVGDRLRIYNLGVFVKEGFTTGAIIVSKKQLKVNFPRNEIMADCPIYQHIEKVVKNNIVKKSKKKYISLTSYERRSILKNIRNGDQKYGEIKSSRILQTAQDKYISFSMFLKDNRPWTFSPIGDRRADSLMQIGGYIVFATEMLESLNYTGEEKDFFSWVIKTLIDNDKYEEYTDYGLSYASKEILEKSKFYADFKTTVANKSTKYITLAHNKLTKVEKRIIHVLEYCNCWNDRKINIGLSDSAEAWTDGRHFINLDRNFIDRLSLSYDADIAHLFSILIHELAHDNATSNTDIHGEDYYEKYHEICTDKYHSPLSYISQFNRSMQTVISNDRKEKRKKQKEEESAALAKKLGITEKKAESVAAYSKK